MSSESPNRPLPRHHRVWWSRLIWKWPVLVWIGIAALAWWLYTSGGQYLRINGLVEVMTESVSPLESGRLVRIDVLAGQVLEAGEAVAQLDTSAIEEEIAVLTQRIQQDRADEQRRFTTAEERLRGELREYTLEQAGARSELAGIEAELEQLQAIEDTGFVEPGRIAGLRARITSLKGVIDLYTRFHADLERELQGLEALREKSLAYPFQAGDSSAEVSELNLLRRRRDEMTLRARQGGVVSQVRREPGEVIRAGDAVVDIIIDRPARIIAFMNEVDTRPVSVGDILEVEPAIGGERFKARLEVVSPNLISLEDRASPLPQRLVRGRRLELVPLGEVSLTPGASMIVFLSHKARLQSFMGGEQP